ncbi:MAG TPA: endonuclease/exonuclease/phosphatase family protein [Phycisphaerales bacterium]|nr:endonuclease/exonuclease/phosphatase family protein [Phycisphaerales bacterium]
MREPDRPAPSSSDPSTPATSPARPRKPFRTFGWTCVTFAALVLIAMHVIHVPLTGTTSSQDTLAYLVFMLRTFEFHIGIAVLCGSLFALLCRFKWIAASAAIIGALYMTPEATRLGFNGGDAPTESEATISILSANVYVASTEPGWLAAHIQREEPDVVLIQEFTPEHRDALERAIGTGYAFRAERGKGGPFGQAIWSKLPFLVDPVIDPHHDPEQGMDRTVLDSGDPMIRVVVSVGGRRVTIQNVHLFPPTSPETLKAQRAEADWLSRWSRSMRDRGEPFIIAGDFNSTLSSETMQSLLASGLHEAQSQAGAGRGTTWPYTPRFRWAPGIKIDHVLMSPDLRATECRQIQGASDHRANMVRLAITARNAAFKVN